MLYKSDIELAHTKDVYQSVRKTLADARQQVHSTINSTMVKAYWNVGRQIYEAQGRVQRAEYSAGLIKHLSAELTAEFGKGFTPANLRNMRQFYLAFPIRYTACSELSWSHYRLLMRIESKDKREFYEHECAEARWSVRQLERQVNSLYYERLTAAEESNGRKIVNKAQVADLRASCNFTLKDPLVLDFLDLKDCSDYRESELEQALISKLQEFMLELGKGFAFVARQKRISSGGKHYYVDLVLYNFILKCFVLIDLKTGSLSHQDIGQIDFYVRIFDDLIKQEDDSPTIGIVLCSDRDENVVRYSILADKDTLLTSRYKLYLPTEKELQCELERERLIIEQSL